MTPEFAKTIDPLFLYVLGLLERIQNKESPTASEESDEIKGRIDRAENQFGTRPDWQLAKYALASWVDELLLLNVEWPGNTWWNENKLEFHYFRSGVRANRFYEKSREAMDLTRKDSLEVFYVCVVLGFRGMYRDNDPELETWARNTARAIELGLGRPPITASPRPGKGAPPLDGKFRLVGAALLAVCLAALNVFVGWYVFLKSN